MGKKLIGILLLLSLLTVKYSPIYSAIHIKASVSMDGSADDAEENAGADEESKQSETPVDELLHYYQLSFVIPSNSITKVIPANLGSTSQYLSSPYLPPEA